MAAAAPAPRTVTLLGKTPARADFIRIHHGAPSAIALDEWLQRNLEELVLGGQRAAPQASFAFAPGGGGDVLVGLLAPSRDKAGRAFPIALFAAVPAAVALQQPAALPLACAPLLVQARALFAELAQLDYDALQARVDAIEAPPADAYAHARTEADALLQETAPAAWLARLFEGADDGAAGRALLALDGAAMEAAGAAAPNSGIAPALRGGAMSKARVLECPVQQTVDALFWLALASRGARTPGSFFWTDPEPAADPAAPPAPTRLLLCPSPPPAHTLLHLAAPRPRPGKLERIVDPAPQASAQPADAARDQLEKLTQCESLAQFVARARG